MPNGRFKKIECLIASMKNEQVILEELKEIKADLKYLKKHIVDVDLVMTDDNIEAIREAEEDVKKGRTKRLI